jgi:hypothetical protein
MESEQAPGDRYSTHLSHQRSHQVPTLSIRNFEVITQGGDIPIKLDSYNSGS